MLPSIGISSSGFSKIFCVRFYKFPASRSWRSSGYLYQEDLWCPRQAIPHAEASHYNARVTLSLVSLHLPKDALVPCLLPSICSTRGHRRYILFHPLLWKMISLTTNNSDIRLFKTINRSTKSSTIPKPWLPSINFRGSKAEYSYCVHWRIGRLPRSCPRYLTQQFSKNHSYWLP